MTFTKEPLQVVFYEKPGCAGNQKQKKLLQSHGIEFITKSILDTPWTCEELSSFFIDLDKTQIINPFAPQIKNKQIDIKELSKDELTELMLKEPILIKRPLLQIGETKICGFDIDKINTIMQKDIASDSKISTCQSEDSCKSV